MGMDQKVLFAPEQTFAWPALAELLAGRDYPLQLRMIDGELCFPDEQPSDAWRELRVSTPDGMVTLRREPDGITLVTWGNADEKLLRAWNALTWALANLTGGTIRTATGSLTLDQFVKTAQLPF